MQNQISVSIIIPAYNEAANYNSGVLDQLKTGLVQLNYDYEVVIIDDGSTDNTAELVSNYVKNLANWKLVKAEHGGKAQTVLRGFKLATKKMILFTDFDQSTPITELVKLVPAVSRSRSIAIGSREMPESQRISEPTLRHIMGRGFNALVQVAALPGIRDSQCGFKLFPSSAKKDIVPKMQLYNRLVAQDAFTGAFDVELLYIAKKQKYQIKEIPIVWTHCESNRVNPLKDSWRMFRDVLLIKRNGITGQYD